MSNEVIFLSILGIQMLRIDIFIDYKITIFIINFINQSPANEVGSSERLKNDAISYKILTFKKSTLKMIFML